MTHRLAKPARPIGERTTRRDYARWRAVSLLLVYALMAAHVTHWAIKGKTLAPLELNEVMYTFELGIVTAGFLFMLAVTLATAVFGRFFCSWGCHILALQDLCYWILCKLHIRPRPIRSRTLLWIPIVAAMYMFVWPQIVRISQGRTLPPLHFRTDAGGWASLATENFWRNLPGPGIALLTFGVCGFLIVYVLGSRAFCTYGCPYGAAFRLADRFAPGRIRLKGDDCRRCGACTAACGSHVRVHEELNRYGMVVNPACLKDLDCVVACPKGNVHFGFGRPSLLKSVLNDTPIRRHYDFAPWEEGVMVLVFLAVLFTFRGLYDRIPFFLSIGLGAISAFLVVLWIRLAYRPALQWNRWTLKANDRLTPTGWAYGATMVAFGAFTIHSSVIRYHSFQGRRYANAGQISAGADVSATKAIRHLEFAERWGLLSSPRDVLLLADMHYQTAGARFKTGRLHEAESHLLAALHVNPELTMARYDLGALLVQKGELNAGMDHLRRVVDAKPDFAEGHYNLALAHWMSGAYDDARSEIDTAFRLNPKDEQTERLRNLMYEGFGP